MNLLLIHQNFPAQFRHIAAHFAADPAHRVVAIGEAANLKRAMGSGQLHPRIELQAYATPPSSGKETHRYLQGYEAAVQRGLMSSAIASQLKASGFLPDIVLAHPGWGEALFLREVFPEVAADPGSALDVVQHVVMLRNRLARTIEAARAEMAREADAREAARKAAKKPWQIWKR